MSGSGKSRRAVYLERVVHGDGRALLISDGSNTATPVLGLGRKPLPRRLTSEHARYVFAVALEMHLLDV